MRPITGMPAPAATIRGSLAARTRNGRRATDRCLVARNALTPALAPPNVPLLRRSRRSSIMVETLDFTTDQNLIHHLVSSQAGKLSKALLEATMNAVDAQATRVSITLSNTGFEVVDDGRGFKSREEVVKFFGRFGTPHEDGDSTYGRYRMGRAQMFNFGKTTWRTGRFRLGVDIRGQDLRYQLEEMPREVRGCRISGELYEPMSAQDLDETISELSSMAKYLQIPLSLNGRKVSRPPRQCEWDSEDDNCWFKSTGSDELVVYNLGVLVCSYPAREFGGGGIVVSKRALAVNFARNDVLTSQCKVWPDLRANLRKANLLKALSRETLTKPIREFLCDSIYYGRIEPSMFPRLMEARLLTDASGRHRPISDLYRYESVTSAPSARESVGARLQRDSTERILVLHHDTLTRLRAFDAKDLLHRLTNRLDLQADGLAEAIDFSSAAERYNTSSTIVPDADAGPMELMAISALRTVYPSFVAWFQRTERSSGPRSLCLGDSDAHEAWTDGKTYIAISRSVLNRAVAKGAPGWLEILFTLAHEHCHDCADLGTHDHTHEFYEKHHDLIQYNGGRLLPMANRCATLFEAAAEKLHQPKSASGVARGRHEQEPAPAPARAEAALPQAAAQEAVPFVLELSPSSPQTMAPRRSMR